MMNLKKLKRKRETVRLILFAIILISISGGCAVTPKEKSGALNSICNLDFVEKKCWVSKTRDQFLSFESLESQQQACAIRPDIACWYGIDSNDLLKIQGKLNSRDGK